MIRIRAAERADAPALVALIRALAAFERLPGPDDAAVARLVEDAFGSRPRIEVLLAELEAEPGGAADAAAAPVAYAILFMTYSTFRARPTLFLEDLFVHPRARRRGVARAVLDHLQALARARGCGRVEWMVLDWNTDAQELYDRYGATRLDDWKLYRVDLPES